MKECNNTTTACGRDPKCCCQCGMDVENIDEQKMGSSMGKFLRTQYYAAKRQGDKIWTAHTRRVLFPDRDPRSFDIAAYAYTFSFCDTREKERAYRAMVAAWAWGIGH